jgi:photosystem II stability/assembly factor-like uncharacterized protein/PKD repeat protein
MNKKLLLIAILMVTIILPSGLNAQDWVSKMNDPNVNFYEVQSAFNKYFAKKDRMIERAKKRASKKKGEDLSEEELEVPGYFQYKRWEAFMAPRVGPNGERFDPSTPFFEMQRYKQQYKTFNSGNWTLLGPSSSVPQNGGNAGRLNAVRIDPNNPNIIFVCSPGGGLWKSIDAGLTWTTNTDNLAQVIGCTDIAIDPTNSNIMYLATGDGNAGDTYSVGILKSTDGGNTWNTTGLSYFSANFRQISKLLIDPTNTNTLLVASSAGVYKSTDGAATFSLSQTGSFKDMEFKPGDPSTVYVAGTEFYKSTDNGTSFTKITSGLPAAANVSRIAIGVSPADPSYVYLIVGLPAPNYGTEGFYKSTTTGASFTKPSTPALGSQQWYDLAIAVSPTNINEVILGGQTDFLRSTNGGTSWSQNGGNTHVDYHDIVFVNSSTYYICCDGGIYITDNNGSSWTDLSNGLQIAQMYGLGQSSLTQNLIIQGWQDNGTNRYNSNGWQKILGGDGMLCFIDWNNDQNMWAEYYNGAFQRSTNGGNSFSNATSGITEAGAWVTPWVQDPVVSSTLYSGFINVWKSTNGGSSWTKISTFSNTATMTQLAVSPANNQVIWAAKPGGLYKSSDGGVTWATISSAPAGNISYIACSNTDANKAWITYSGFTNTNKVFQTNDQGATWTNLSASIPNIPVNCIVYQNGSNDGVYIGTDVGVFYKDAGMSVWQPFFQGLPNVVVSQLAIYNPTGKIRASTYGRGLWESDLYVAGTYAPTAAFGSDKKVSCQGAAIQFSDYTAGEPTSWQWSFPGGVPSSSTAQNPVVYYNTAGTYSATLIATNANGIDTITYNNFININTSLTGNPATIGDTRCGAGPVSLTASGSGSGTLRWWDALGGGNLLATGASFNPTITGTTSYYVDEEFPVGAIDYAGEFSNSNGAGSFFTANDIRGLYFDVINPVILNSVQVYSNSAGNRTIEILDSQGNLYKDTTVFIPATNSSTPTTVNLNFVLYPGTNYFIKCRGYVDLYRNSAGTIYPLISSSVNVTGSNAGSPGYYYFFYFWEFTDFTCNTGRTECIALDSCSSVGIQEVNLENSLEVFPNPTSGAFNLSFETSEREDYQISVVNSLGETVYQYTLNEFSGKHQRAFDFTSYAKGVYLINIHHGSKNIVRKVTLN